MFLGQNPILQVYSYRKKTKIGKVTIEEHCGYFRLRFTYPAKHRHELKVSKISEEGFATATKRARQINADIENDCFDFDYIRYKPNGGAKTLNVVKDIVEESKIENTPLIVNDPESQPAPEIINITAIWNQYKETNKLIVGKTTQLSTWKQTDNCLGKVSEEALNINNNDQLVSELLTLYSVGTLERVFANLKAACNEAIRAKVIGENPFVGRKLPKRAKSKIECYESDEIKVILEAFKSDEYMSKYARIPHSYYYHYIKFCALTFCRPEDAIALTWNDIRTRSNGTFISFTKAHSRGILKDSKTHEIRLFKCNKELVDFIKTIPRRKNDHNILFPTPRTKSYMDQRSWGRDLWKPVVSKIVADGRLYKYLKFYSLRHSGITRLVRAGIDIATIARLAGTSPEMIMKNYLAARDNIDLPNL